MMNLGQICPKCGFWDQNCKCQPVTEERFEEIWMEHRKRKELEDLEVVDWDLALKALLGKNKKEF